MKDKTYAANGRARGLMALPIGEVPTGIRCLQIAIPDSDDAIRMLAGALYELTHWTNYARESGHKATQWAQAWRAALLDGIPWDECMNIQFQQTLCGLEVSFDGGETWAVIYDGMDCLSSQGAQEFFDGLIDDRIQDLIDDGTLQQNGSQPSPTTPPSNGGCTTNHVILRGQDRWRLPYEVSSGDVVQIANVAGGWTDGTLTWYCGDGRTYFASICNTNEPAHVGDPLQTANHMKIVAGYNTGAPVYFDPITAYTVPPGVSNQALWLQANDGSLADDAGQVECNITVCRPGWYHYFDYTQSGDGWSNWSYSNITWQAGTGYVVGTHISNYYEAAIRRIVTMPSDCHIIQAKLYFTGNDVAYSKWFNIRPYPSGADIINLRVSTATSSPVNWGTFDVSHNGQIYLGWIFDHSANGAVTVRGLELIGTGTEPSW